MFVQSRLYGGLSPDEAAASRLKYGANALTRKKRKGFFRYLLGNLGDPMIRVLLVALGINVIFLFGKSHWYESAGICAAILISITVSALSEYGGEAAFEKLRENAMNASCRVRRGGRTAVIPVADLVVGDVVLLGAGDKIPADGELIDGTLDADQSALNGESKDAEKRARGGAGEGFLDPRRVYGGTAVTGGEGVMRVTAVGDATFYGKLAAEVQDGAPESPLKLKLSKLAKKISFYGYIGAGGVAFSYLFNAVVIASKFDGGQILSRLTDLSFLFPCAVRAATLAVTVIVMAVPEGLPMMITVVLSANMRRMARDNVLVRRLSGIETAGGMNILFTDKTGTLTYGRPEVIGAVTGDGRAREAREFYAAGALSEAVAANLILNNGAEFADGKIAGGNATDRAVLEFARKIPFNADGITRVTTVPFSGQNKFMSTRARGRLNASLVKGAPEKILPRCAFYLGANGEKLPLTSFAALERAAAELGARAVRVIALAAGDGAAAENLEPGADLTLTALIGIRDEIRSEAREGVRRITGAGIQTVMITGDARGTAEAIAREAGILENGGLIITSDELGAMTDRTLTERLKDLRVVARALPSDKSRLVKAAQSAGLVVGMTGDGVNDAPALKRADVGFAMGGGAEVAKDAGDVVILDDNILSVSKAVSYGRTIFKSIRKFVIFQMTVNFCAVAVSIIAPFLNIETPITVIQILWINLVIDTLAGLAFGGERPRARYMTEKPMRRDEPIIGKPMRRQILFMSAYAAAVSLWFLKSGFIERSFAGGGEAYEMTAFFTLFMFIAVFNAMNARTHSVNLFDYLALNKQFLLIMGGVATTQILLIYFGGAVFRTVPLSPAHLLWVILLAFTVIPADLIRKAVTGGGDSTVRL